MSEPTTLLLCLTLLARGLVHGKCSVNSRGEALTCRHRPARPLSQRPSIPVHCPGLPCPRCRRPWTFTTLYFLLLHFLARCPPAPAGLPWHALGSLFSGRVLTSARCWEPVKAHCVRSGCAYSTGAFHAFVTYIWHGKSLQPLKVLLLLQQEDKNDLVGLG